MGQFESNVFTALMFSPPGGVPHDDDQWLTVHADQEYVLSIDLQRVNKVKVRNILRSEIYEQINEENVLLLRLLISACLSTLIDTRLALC